MDKIKLFLYEEFSVSYQARSFQICWCVGYYRIDIEEDKNNSSITDLEISMINVLLCCFMNCKVEFISSQNQILANLLFLSKCKIKTRIPKGKYQLSLEDLETH